MIERLKEKLKLTRTNSIIENDRDKLQYLEEQDKERDQEIKGKRCVTSLLEAQILDMKERFSEIVHKYEMSQETVTELKKQLDKQNSIKLEKVNSSVSYSDEYVVDLRSRLYEISDRYNSSQEEVIDLKCKLKLLQESSV